MIFFLFVRFEYPVYINKFVGTDTPAVDVKRIEIGFIPFNTCLEQFLLQSGVLNSESVPERIVHGVLCDIALCPGGRSIYKTAISFERRVENFHVRKPHGSENIIACILHPDKIFEPTVLLAVCRIKFLLRIQVRKKNNAKN